MPMWSSVATLKESLSKIALDVHDDDDDDEQLSIYTPPRRDQPDSRDSVSERRISLNFNGSASPTHSSLANGFGSSSNYEIEQYKVEINRLKESEAEIKALSVNYAALLKEKENQISRLIEEKNSMKHNLLTSKASHDSSKAIPRVSGDISPDRHNKAPIKIRTSGSPLSNGNVPKHNDVSNGTTSPNAKELFDMIENNNRSHAIMQATHEAQTKQMMSELEKERDKLASLRKKMQEEQKLNGLLQQELSTLKDENSKMLMKMQKTHDELNQKISEVERLQKELWRSKQEESRDTVEKLKNTIATLQDENRSIKKEKDDIDASLRGSNAHPVHNSMPDPNKNLSSVNEASPEMKEMQQSLSKMGKDLKETRRERDKALHELNRLKQHLLAKESEESEKMDEDSKIIEELREINEHQRFQISSLENAHKQAIGAQEEIKMSNNSELKKAKESIDELNRKLVSCVSTIDAKNMEVLNLQTALGQYYAEIEAKEHLADELSVAKQESARLSNQLKEAHQQAEISKREKEEIMGKLSQTERMLAEGKSRIKKIEEDNEKLRRALEQSMTRLNRMSVDSDFLVDRRIVIKLLVTYFQRNHSKEVLDLMVRMLGFSDEDKQRIGLAQQGTGKGVVRGVLGIPGRLVGGILGSGTAEAHPSMASDNQSFADLWVDFLLNEEERGKREPEDGKSPGTITSPSDANRGATNTASDISSPTTYQMPGNFLHREPSDSEFSTVPLTSESTSRGSWLPQRY